MSCNHRPSSYPELNYTSGAKWSKNLTKDRLGTFNGGHYSDVNLSAVLFTHRIDNAEHVKLKVYVLCISRVKVDVGLSGLKICIVCADGARLG